MAILIKLMRNRMPHDKNSGKWFAKTGSTGEAHTEDIARKVEADTTFTRGEVKGMMDALTDTMTEMLQDGKTVVIDGFGRFRLTVESLSAEKPEAFHIGTNIKGVKCHFLPVGRKSGRHGRLKKTFCENTEVKFAPMNAVEK